MKITHLVLWVQDATLSVKFYKKIGFTEQNVTERDAYVILGDFGIHLITMRDDDEFTNDSLAAQKGLGMYMYIKVDNVDATYQAMTAKRLKPYTQPRDWPWGNREFVIKDPDGYKLCFYHTVPL